MGAACRELGAPRDPTREMKVQRKAMEKAREAATTVARLENELQDYQTGDGKMLESRPENEPAHFEAVQQLKSEAECRKRKTEARCSPSPGNGYCSVDLSKPQKGHGN